MPSLEQRVSDLEKRVQAIAVMLYEESQEDNESAETSNAD